MSTLSALEKLTNRSAALATYRHLLRATKIAFAGKFEPHNNAIQSQSADSVMLLEDLPILRASRAHARDGFRKGRTLVSGSVEAAQGIEHAQGVTQILRENLVQGRNVGGEKYKLNIHEHTQRLDNDTAGNLKGTRKSFKEIKDSVF